jgi:hypothetical protein
MRRRSVRLLFQLATLALAAIALFPLLDRAVARRQARQALDETRRMVGAARDARRRPERLRCPDLDGAALLRVRATPVLASWGDIGGCGAGGGASSSTGGGVKWVGRGVQGGLIDVQCLASETFVHGNEFTFFNVRLGTRALTGWNFGLYVPVLYKIGDVTVLGATRTAHMAGFGDVSVEASRKLGITGAHLLTLGASAPSGAWDAVRRGVVLPQHLQLGSGTLGVSGAYEYTFDRDWGLAILGAGASYGGWENSIGDFRSPSASAYTHVGFFLGPLVPSVGLTLFGKPMRDRERGEDKPTDTDPRFMITPNVTLEWASDELALLLSASTAFSTLGFENATVTLGISASLF